jgi:hypothetical protein
MGEHHAPAYVCRFLLGGHRGLRAQERAFEVMAGRMPEWEELEFKVVEREVALDVP